MYMIKKEVETWLDIHIQKLNKGLRYCSLLRETTNSRKNPKRFFKNEVSRI